MFPPKMYQDETFWLVVLAIFCGVMFFTENIPAAVGLMLAIVASPLALPYLIEFVKRFRVAKSPVAKYTDGITLGLLNNKTPISLDLESMNHVFIIGMTRYGKTRLVLSLIIDFITKYRPDEVKLAFSDAKAVSFNVFARSQHLFAPIAKSEPATERLIELVLAEMHRRLSIFSEYHEEICTNVDEYFELSGERLPRIVVIFDEVADSVEMNSPAEKNLTTLAKMGLAAGIHLILITQRPTKVGISHEITSQCQTILSTFMKNQVEYGSVAKIPQQVYKKMSPVKGLFMVFSPDLAPYFLTVYPEYEGWGFLNSVYIDNEKVREIAIEDSSSNLSLPELESSIPAWEGSEEDKFFAMSELEQKVGKLTTEDMQKVWGIDRRTAKNWLEKFNAMRAE